MTVRIAGKLIVRTIVRIAFLLFIRTAVRIAQGDFTAIRTFIHRRIFPRVSRPRVFENIIYYYLFMM